MRILLVNAKRSLADALARYEGMEVGLVSPRKYQVAMAPGTNGVKLNWYAGGEKLSPRAAWQMRRLVHDVCPDVVHAFYGRALAHVVLAARTMRRRPKIVSFRGITAPLSVFNAGDWLTYRHSLVSGHACESQAVRESLVDSGIDGRRCWVTFNSMASTPARRPGRQGLEQFGIPRNAFVVGTIATMRRVKGIDILLRAAAQCADLSDAYWVLFGHVVDPELQTLAADPRIRGRVRLVGHRPDASELISGADLFVMPSRAEALCQALLEAMHQGVCPVVSNAGGMKEVVGHEKDGLVVAAEDVAALAGAIRRLHADRQMVARYAAAAQQRVDDEFTPEKMAERCLQMYHELLGHNQSRGAA